jgi:hypothetical protein
MNPWNPIETAPKDGTMILLYVGAFEDDYAVAFWSGEYWHIGNPKYVKDGDKFNFEFGKPTHWMLLPPPPYFWDGDTWREKDD